MNLVAVLKDPLAISEALRVDTGGRFELGGESLVTLNGGQSSKTYMVGRGGWVDAVRAKRRTPRLFDVLSVESDSGDTGD